MSFAKHLAMPTLQESFTRDCTLSIRWFAADTFFGFKRCPFSEHLCLATLCEKPRITVLLIVLILDYFCHLALLLRVVFSSSRYVNLRSRISYLGVQRP